MVGAPLLASPVRDPGTLPGPARIHQDQRDAQEQPHRQTDDDDQRHVRLPSPLRKRDRTTPPFVPSAPILARPAANCPTRPRHLLNAYSTSSVGFWFGNRWPGDRQALICPGHKKSPRPLGRANRGKTGTQRMTSVGGSDQLQAHFRLAVGVVAMEPVLADAPVTAKPKANPAAIDVDSAQDRRPPLAIRTSPERKQFGHFPAPFVCCSGFCQAHVRR